MYSRSQLTSIAVAWRRIRLASLLYILAVTVLVHARTKIHGYVRSMFQNPVNKNIKRMQSPDLLLHWE
jgi:hypothetical protein